MMKTLFKSDPSTQLVMRTTFITHKLMQLNFMTSYKAKYYLFAHTFCIYFCCFSFSHWMLLWYGDSKIQVWIPDLLLFVICPLTESMCLCVHVLVSLGDGSGETKHRSRKFWSCTHCRTLWAKFGTFLRFYQKILQMMKTLSKTILAPNLWWGQLSSPINWCS